MRSGVSLCHSERSEESPKRYVRLRSLPPFTRGTRGGVCHCERNKMERGNLVKNKAIIDMRLPRV